MTLKIDPSAYFGLDLSEEEEFTLDIVDQLAGDTVKTYTMTITNSAGQDVTTNFGKSSAESAGVITAGVKGYAVGTYTITFWITCNEFLPDTTTRRKFKVVMTLVVT